MRRQIHSVRTVMFLVAMGLAAPAWAGGSASAINTDPVTGEVTLTTTSVSNADGSHTITLRDPNGNVLTQITVTTDRMSGERTRVEVHQDGSKTISKVNATGEPVSGVTEPPKASAGFTYSTNANHHVSEDPNHVPHPKEILLDELLDLEDQVLDLRRQRDDLLGEAVRTEDRDKREKLGREARRVLDELGEVQDAYAEKKIEAKTLGLRWDDYQDPGDSIGLVPGIRKKDHIAVEIGQLTQQLEAVREEAEYLPLDDDKRYDELKNQENILRRRIHALEQEYDGRQQERTQEAEQKESDRLRRQTQISSQPRAL